MLGDWLRALGATKAAKTEQTRANALAVARQDAASEGGAA